MDEKTARHFEQFIAAKQPPAIVLGVMKDGQLQLVLSHGLDQAAPRQSPEAVQFRIASMTKSFAAAGVLLLRDEGKLRLEDPVSRYVAELRGNRQWDNVRIFDLLSMQSGLPSDDPWGDRQMYLADEEFSALLQQPISFAAAPREDCFYSNLGYMILGRTISNVAGEHALAFLQRRLLDPLGMTQTVWNAHSPSAIAGYARRNGELVAEPVQQITADLAVFAGLWSTLRDLACWIAFLTDAFHECAAHYEAVMKSCSRRELQRGVVAFEPDDRRVPDQEPAVYGLGLKRVFSQGSWAVAHTGGLPGYGSHMRWSLEKRFAVVAMANLTYAPVLSLCRDVFSDLLAEFPDCALPPCEIVRTRAQQLQRLMHEWDAGAANGIFASNFFLDADREFRRRQFQELRSAASSPASSFTVRQEPGLGATILLEGKPALRFWLAPGEDAKVQEIKMLQAT